MPGEVIGGGSFANPSIATGQAIGSEGQFGSTGEGGNDSGSGSTTVKKHLIKKGNKSGTHKPTPHMMFNLLNNLKSLPFQLFGPGAAALKMLGPMLQGIIQASQMLGGLHNVGNLGNVMGQIGQQLGVTGDLSNLTQAHILALHNAPNAQDLVDQLTQAVGGPGIAAGLAAMSFGDQSNIMNIVNGTPGNTDSHDHNPDPSTIPQVTPPVGTGPTVKVDPSDLASVGMLDNMVLHLEV